MPRPPAPPPRGILERASPDGVLEHRRVLPSPTLAPCIAHFWWVRWDLRSPFVAETLPHPSVHVLFERSSPRTIKSEVSGVPTGGFARQLRGTGVVFGIKFRPAAFQPVLGAPMSTLTDRVVPLKALFLEAAAPMARGVHACLRDASLERATSVAEGFLERVLPVLPSEVVRLRDLVERLATDRAITRVEDAAALVSLDVRTLQRRFAKFVGVSPKWVIQRYRLHEAAAQLARPDAPSLGALAASLGYFDQPHFVRDFKAVVGHPPGQYARR